MTALGLPHRFLGVSRATAGRWGWRALILAVLAGIALIHVVGFVGAPFWDDDEGTYVAQAWAIENLGSLAHYTYWYDHPPLGWMAIAGWTYLTGAFDRTTSVTAIREFVLLCQLGGAVLIYIVARRLDIRRHLALVAMLVFSLSPLALHYHRIGYLDNISIPLVLGAFALALTPRRAMWPMVGAAIVFALAVLVKETSLLFLPALALLIWQRAPKENRMMAMSLAFTLFASLTAMYVLFAALKGELFPGEGHVSLFEAIEFQLLERVSNGTVLDGGSSANDRFVGWLQLDAWLLVLGGLATPFMLAVKRFRFIGVSAVLLALMLIRPGYLPQPFVIMLLPIAALSIAAGLELISQARLPGWVSRPIRVQVTGSRVAVAALVLGALVVAPGWASKDMDLLSAGPSESQLASYAFVRNELPRDSNLLVENTVWVDLVESGFDPDKTVWFYKLDLDPEVAARFPNGHQDFDYVVATPAMRAAVEYLPEIKKALANSRLVAAFGSGTTSVEIRAVGDAPVDDALVAAAENYRDAKPGWADGLPLRGTVQRFASATATVKPPPLPPTPRAEPEVAVAPLRAAAARPATEVSVPRAIAPPLALAQIAPAAALVSADAPEAAGPDPLPAGIAESVG